MCITLQLARRQEKRSWEALWTKRSEIKRNKIDFVRTQRECDIIAFVKVHHHLHLIVFLFGSALQLFCISFSSLQLSIGHFFWRGISSPFITVFLFLSSWIFSLTKRDQIRTSWEKHSWMNGKEAHEKCVPIYERSSPRFKHGRHSEMIQSRVKISFQGYSEIPSSEVPTWKRVFAVRAKVSFEIKKKRKKNDLIK